MKYKLRQSGPQTIIQAPAESWFIAHVSEFIMKEARFMVDKLNGLTNGYQGEFRIASNGQYMHLLTPEGATWLSGAMSIKRHQKALEMVRRLNKEPI